MEKRNGMLTYVGGLRDFEAFSIEFTRSYRVAQNSNPFCKVKENHLAAFDHLKLISDGNSYCLNS